MTIPAIKTWKYVFLDTTVIVDLLVNPDRFNKNPEVKERILRTQMLFEALQKINRERGEIWFLISAVTLGELTKTEDETSVKNDIIRLLNTEQVVIIDYGASIAEFVSKGLGKYIENRHVNSLLKEFELVRKEGGNVINARNWVSDDLKIAATAKTYKKIDVLLTGDKKTFFPIAQKLNIPVLLTNDIPKDIFEGVDTDIVIDVNRV